MKIYENYYDEIVYPPELREVHYKVSITKRNEGLINNSDLLVAYVIKDKGGAADCLNKAIKRGMDIRRLDRKSVGNCLLLS